MEVVYKFDFSLIEPPSQVEVKHFAKIRAISPDHVFDVLLEVFFE